MQYGYVTLTEANSYMRNRIGADAWIKNESVLTKISGSATTSAVDSEPFILTGVNTALDTDLTLTDALYLEGYPFEIISIDSATQVTLKKSIQFPIELLTAISIYKFPKTSLATFQSLTQKKIQSLMTANRTIMRMIGFAESGTTEDNDLKYGVFEWALWLFSGGEERQKLINQGVTSFSVSKFSESYADPSAKTSKQIGPDEAWVFLDKFKTYDVDFDYTSPYPTGI